MDYGSLAGGFTEPLVEIVTRAVEFWATREPARREPVAIVPGRF